MFVSDLTLQPVSLADHPLLSAIHNALDPGGPGTNESELAAIEAAGVCVCVCVCVCACVCCVCVCC